ncbi:hypothetical protein WR25_02883 [Diploscapter pachys]|uniref:Uncharacterized protein n=1 Tax=Diploscapter pachys TaxID=2018661 RepID=A0A2A2K8X5_9BILA|nr:hypothetical protein WR25_02883 [Diploscapter pachys]
MGLYLLAQVHAQALERELQGIGEVGLGGQGAQVQPQMHDGLRDLRAHAADDAVGAHQTDGGDGLEQMLGDQGIDSRHTSDVDDGDFRTGVDDTLQQRLHHGLASLRIERADQRQGQHAIPQLDHRSGQLQQLFLLALDNRFAGLLEGADGVHP